MHGQDKVMLYYLNMQTDTAGESVVERSDIAAFLKCSKPTVVKHMKAVIGLGYVACKKMPFAIGRGHGFKYQYHITERGVSALSIQEGDAKELFELFKIMRFEEIAKQAKTIGNKIVKSKKVAKGQMTLW